MPRPNRIKKYSEKIPDWFSMSGPYDERYHWHCSLCGTLYLPSQKINMYWPMKLHGFGIHQVTYKLPFFVFAIIYIIDCFEIKYCGFSPDYPLDSLWENSKHICRRKNEQISEISSLTTLSWRFVQWVHYWVSE